MFCVSLDAVSLFSCYWKLDQNREYKKDAEVLKLATY